VDTRKALIVLALVTAVIVAVIARSCGGAPASPPGGTGSNGGSAGAALVTPGHGAAARAAFATLGGRVTRASDGAPIANATVSIAGAELMAMFVKNSSPTIVVHTDASGVWSATNVRPGAYIVAATAKGYLPGAREKLAVAPASDHRALDLVLAAGGTIVSGTVTDVGGGAIGDARIVAAKPQRELQLGGSAELVAQTGPDGRYELTLPDGEFRLGAEHDDYTRDTESITVAGVPLVVDFKLVPGAVLRGQVIARDTGAAVPGAIVHAEATAGNAGDGTTFADDEGNFVLRGLGAGALELRALGKGYASPAPTVVDIGIGEQLDGVRVVVDRAYAISGKVVRKGGGTALPGITLGAFSILSQQFGIALSPSASDGAFEIVGLRPAEYNVFAVGEGSVPDVGKSVTIVDRDVRDVVVELEAGVRVTGRVEPPVAGAEIAIAMAGEVGLENMFEMVKSALVRGETDASGVFVLEHVPAGAFKATARAKDGAEGTVPVTVAAIDLDNVVIALAPRASIAGRVTDTSGKPVGNFFVRAAPKVQSQRPDISFGGERREDATTNADGTFVLVGLEPGAYTMSAKANRWESFVVAPDPKQVEVTLAKAEKKTGVNLVVPARDGVIRGTVMGPDHRPAADAWVHAHRAMDTGGMTMMGGNSRRFGASSAPVLTGPDGRFAIEKLEPGTYDLEVDGPRGASHAEKPGVKTGESVTIDLVSLGTIAGVVTVGGAPVAKYTIECDGAARDITRQIEAKDGAYALERLPPGKYRCTVEGDAGTAEGTDVEVPAGKVTQNFALVRWATITGVIVGALDKQPVAKVTVLAGGQYSSSNMSAVLGGRAPKTDAAGRFTIERVGVGSGTVAVMPPSGFQPLGQREYTVTEGQRLDLGTIEIVRPRDGEAGTLGFETKLDGDKLVIDVVVDGGPAKAAGLQVGDRVVSIDGREVATLTPIIGKLVLESGNMATGTVVALGIERGGAQLQVTVTATTW